MLKVRKTDLNPTDFVKCNFYFKVEGVGRKGGCGVWETMSFSSLVVGSACWFHINLVQFQFLVNSVE